MFPQVTELTVTSLSRLKVFLGVSTAFELYLFSHRRQKRGRCRLIEEGERRHWSDAAKKKKKNAKNVWSHQKLRTVGKDSPLEPSEQGQPC